MCFPPVRAPVAIGAVAATSRRTRTMASVKVSHVILDLDGTLINTGARATRVVPPRSVLRRAVPTSPPQTGR